MLVLAVWLVVLRIFPAFNDSRHLLVALLLTYLAAAYLIFPVAVRLSGLLSRRKHIPRYTASPDGLPTDPVNIVVVGSYAQLQRAYADTDWQIADTLSLRTSWRMVTSFITNKPYPTAPFSNLYLFGRKQDIGFQKAIGGSPRKRHHVRYWALNEQSGTDYLTREFWYKKRHPDLAHATIWVGAGTRDTGFGFTKVTFQISHAVDADTIKERDFMVTDLRRSKLVTRTTLLEPDATFTGQGKINSFVTDGAVAVVYLDA